MPTPGPADYGNMPLTVAGQPTDPAQKSKLEANGLKFGKKVGKTKTCQIRDHANNSTAWKCGNIWYGISGLLCDVF